MQQITIRQNAVRLTLAALIASLVPVAQAQKPDRKQIKDIKAYCIDFNWAPTKRRGKPFAKPGLWADKADPAKHVEWYKTMGANVIQTFCVSTNGYAWYKNGFIPEQPGLKHDFLPEVVKLGHKEGMLVIGYFCVAANPKWGQQHPDQSYGTPTTYHIPYTDEYLDYLYKSINDAVKKTGVDGIMLDWIWMPKRKSTDGKWLESEKKLYTQLMGEPFPGEDKLSKDQDTQYSRKAIDRAWKTARKAAKDADPDCVVWVTVNHMHHPHVINSDMYKEADWLMNEAGSVDAIRKIEDSVGKDTHLITCLAVWNGQDASKTVPEALQAGVGLYGFTTPLTKEGLVPLDKIFSKQVTELSGDDKNIAVLARAFHGVSVYSVWKDGEFVEPNNPPPFRLALQGRGRGLQDTANIAHDTQETCITIRTPYNKGKGSLELTAKSWPSSLVIRFEKKTDMAADVAGFRIVNGEVGFVVALDGSGKVTYGKPKAGLKLPHKPDEEFFKEVKQDQKVRVEKNDRYIEIEVPKEIIQGNPSSIAFDWEKP